MKQVDSNVKSFFALFKLKNEGKFDQKVRLPKYKPRGDEGYCTLTFTKKAFRFNSRKDHVILTLPKYMKKKFKVNNKILKFKLPKAFRGVATKRIRQIELVPHYNANFFTINFSYEIPILKDSIDKFEKKTKSELFNPSLAESDIYRTLAIDIGVKNLLSMVNCMTGESIIIDGKSLNSHNRYINKEIARLKSNLASFYSNKAKTSKRIQRLLIQREDYIKDFFHKIAVYLIQYCKNKDLKHIVIGKNPEFKQEVDIGKQNNQNLTMIAHSKLIDYLVDKARLQGIVVEVIEESYTSKVDALANEAVKKQLIYLGKRVKRGLFQSSTNKVINADINGSLNIFRKWKKSKGRDDSLSGEIVCSGRVYRPYRVVFFNGRLIKRSLLNQLASITSSD